MTGTSRSDRAAPVAEDDEYGRPVVHGSANWVVFGGVMLLLLGFVHAIEGLVALLDDGYYRVRPSGLAVHVSYTAWGWVHLVLGIVAALTGIGLLAGAMAARVLGVVLAVLSAVVNLGFIAAYPLWSAIVITLDVVVIHAIVVHGAELKRRV